MRIGLVRHFKVDHNSSLVLNPRGFADAMKRYDNDPIVSNGLSVNKNDWDICLCSTLPRAIETAKIIYDGNIIYSDKLIEVNMYPFTQKQIMLPSIFWHIAARIHWYNNKSTQIETRDETSTRVKEVLDLIGNYKEKNVLLVSHGFFMRQLYKGLIKKGFHGKIDEAPRNGKLYLIKNSEF